MDNNTDLAVKSSVEKVDFGTDLVVGPVTGRDTDGDMWPIVPALVRWRWSMAAAPTLVLVLEPG